MLKEKINAWRQDRLLQIVMRNSGYLFSSNTISITLTDNGLGDDILTGADGVIVDQGGPGWPPIPSGGGHSAPVFPNIYVGIGAALGAGIVAYALRRRLAAHRTE